jgi:ribosomal protein L7/L12
MQLAPSDVRIERFRVLDNWNVRATQISTGISEVVLGSDDLGQDRQNAVGALASLLDDIELVRSMIGDGSSLDGAASALVKQRGGERSPVRAIKAMRAAAGLDLREAKLVVHRNLSSSAQEAAERLWDAAEEALAEDDPGGGVLDQAR